MSSLNEVTLIGRIGQDPEVRAMQDGKEMVHFSLATSRIWKDKTTGEKKQQTEWHRVVVFSPQIVDIIKKYVKRGSKIYARGSLQTRKWTDKDGAEKYTTEVVLSSYDSNIILLDSKSDTDGFFGDQNKDGKKFGTDTSDARNTSQDTPNELYNSFIEDDNIPF